MKVLVPFALLTIFAFPQLSAQEPPAKSGQNENYKFRANSDLIFLPTVVQKKNGEIIYNLKPEQFIVEDNGVRQSVSVEEDPDSSGMSLVVAVQCGRSAPAEFSKLKGLGTMIEAIVGDAPHEVAIVSYGEVPYLLGDFSNNSAAVRGALAKLKPCGAFHAASIDAAYYAMAMLNRRQSHYRRAILLVSETRDHGSRSKLHEVVAELGVTNTVIYSVTFSPIRDEIVSGFRYGDNPPAPSAPPVVTPLKPVPSEASSPAHTPDEAVEPEDYTDHAPLFEMPPQLMLVINALRRNSALELATLSGGSSMSFTSQRDFEDSLERISNQIHNYYLLSYKPQVTSTLGLHSLRVRVPEFPQAAIQTRKSYWSGIVK